MKSRVFPSRKTCPTCHLVRVGIMTALLATMLGSAPPQPAYAATITVNTLEDEDNTDGDCSLREAIYAANNNVSRDACIAGTYSEVIDLTGVAGTITLGGAELMINSNLTINGPGAGKLTISGNHASRVFHIDVNVVVVIISDVTIANGNSIGSHGGGIWNTGTLTINRCTLASNRTTLGGGGIANFHEATINRSTFYDNEANLSGGGILNDDGRMTVNNSTFSGNRASEGATDNFGGGAIFNTGEYESTELTINSSTITLNSAKWGGGISINDGTMNIKNTIVAENTVHAGGSGPNCYNSATQTSSYNLESGTDCGFTGTGDLQSADADLGSLQDNGGSTWTHALPGSSPAVNAGICTDINGNPVTIDQRGSPRLNPCDIGAYEYVLWIYLPLVRHDSS